MPHSQLAQTDELKRSIRVKILFILSLALSPILLIALVQTLFDTNNAKKARISELVTISDRATDSVEQAIKQAESLLLVFQPEIEKNQCEKTFEKVIIGTSLVSNVVQFDADGKALCNARGKPGFEVYDTNWIDEVQHNSGVLRTEAFWGSESKDWLFSILLASRDEENNFIGASTFGLNTTAIVNLIKNTSLPKDTDIGVFDNNGQIFGSTRFKEIREEWQEAIDETEAQSLLFKDDTFSEGLDIVVTKLGGQNLYAIISAPSPGLLSQFTLRPAAIIGIPLMAFSLTLLVTWLALDRILLRWLTRLRALALAYGRGAYDMEATRFEQAPSELEDLAISMEAMARKISVRDESLKQAIETRDAAVKEIHHRVKNNLQIVTSYLNLQSRQVKENSAKEALKAARHRIDALSIVHQTLYQNERLSDVDLHPFLTGLISHLQEALGANTANVTITSDIDSFTRNSDDAIPLALLIVEAITNSMKYAFDSKGGKIHIALKHIGKTGLTLQIEDNGIGSEIDKNTTPSGTGLGQKLMLAFARQMGGSFEEEATKDGFLVRVTVQDSSKI